MRHESPRAFFPQYLTNEQISIPQLALQEFVTIYSISHAKGMVKKWMKAVYHNGDWNDTCAADVLFFYNNLIQLFEAAWLLNQIDTDECASNILSDMNDSFDLMNPALYCKVSQFSTAFENFPRTLTEGEFINPYKVFKKIFNYLTLYKWKDVLYELLSMGLSTDTMEATSDYFDLVTIKRHLDKIIEASCLIVIRELEEPEEVKITDGNKQDDENIQDEKDAQTSEALS